MTRKRMTPDLVRKSLGFYPNRFLVACENGCATVGILTPSSNPENDPQYFYIVYF